MKNVHFEAGPAEVIRPDVIVVDPPRKGCDPALLAKILELQPAARRIRVVQCIDTGSRLAHAGDGGYGVAEVTSVDMFPHNVHVESVALLVRTGTEW